jgi:putative IMPACT (imprinted ancient) family translation regulator
MLEVLLGAGVHDVLVVVTRYFGGTLLGTGGLVRAYSAAVRAGMAASVILTKQSGRKAMIQTDYNSTGKLQHIVAENGLTVFDTRYTDRVTMTVLVPENQKETFQEEVREATAGQAQIEWSDPLFFAVQDGNPILFPS